MALGYAEFVDSIGGIHDKIFIVNFCSREGNEIHKINFGSYTENEIYFGRNEKIFRFSFLENFFHFVHDGGYSMAVIKLCSDAKFDIIPGSIQQFATNKFIVTEIIPASITATGEKYSIKNINIDNYDINDPNVMSDLTKKICMTNVKQYGCTLEFVKEQTPIICVAAVQQDGFALEFVKQHMFMEQDVAEICFAAVRQHGWALRFVEYQTYNICLEAVKNFGGALEYVIVKYENICAAAIQNDGLALQYMDANLQTLCPEICIEAVRRKPMSLRYVYDQTEEICMIAALYDIDALYCIRDQNLRKSVHNKILSWNESTKIKC